MRVLLVLSFLVFLSPSVQAQEIFQCGVPDNPKLEKTDDPESWKYCDIYSRRFSYAEEQKAFREQLEERRENYVAYRERAYRNYQDDLELYHLLID